MTTHEQPPADQSDTADSEQATEEASSHADGQKDLAEALSHEQQSVPSHVRETVMERDQYRCQLCGDRGAEGGGHKPLHVHHQQDDPDHCDPHDPANLITLDVYCHRWVHQQPSPDDLDPALKQLLDGVNIEATWIDILRYLSADGPATTGDITNATTLDSKPGIRQALYGLMSLDVRHDDVNEQLVAKDRLDRTYGLPWQIDDDRMARGTVPLLPAERRTRILDEIARRVYEALPEKATEDKKYALISDIVDRTPQQVRKMRRRAQAMQFPFEEWVDHNSTTTAHKNSEAVVLEAIETLAKSSDNISRQALGRAIADVFESNDEAQLASFLRTWSTTERSEQQTLASLLTQTSREGDVDVAGLTPQQEFGSVTDGQSSQSGDETISD